jgi:hypothetical protein
MYLARDTAASAITHLQELFIGDELKRTLDGASTWIRRMIKVPR